MAVELALSCSDESSLAAQMPEHTAAGSGSFCFYAKSAIAAAAEHAGAAPLFPIGRTHPHRPARLVIAKGTTPVVSRRPRLPAGPPCVLPSRSHADAESGSLPSGTHSEPPCRASRTAPWLRPSRAAGQRHCGGRAAAAGPHAQPSTQLGGPQQREQHQRQRKWPAASWRQEQGQRPDRCPAQSRAGGAGQAGRHGRRAGGDAWAHFSCDSR